MLRERCGGVHGMQLVQFHTEHVMAAYTVTLKMWSSFFFDESEFEFVSCLVTVSSTFWISSQRVSVCSALPAWNRLTGSSSSLIQLKSE